MACYNLFFLLFHPFLSHWRQTALLTLPFLLGGNQKVSDAYLKAEQVVSEAYLKPCQFNFLLSSPSPRPNCITWSSERYCLYPQTLLY